MYDETFEISEIADEVDEADEERELFCMTNTSDLSAFSANFAKRSLMIM